MSSRLVEEVAGSVILGQLTGYENEKLTEEQFDCFVSNPAFRGLLQCIKCDVRGNFVLDKGGVKNAGGKYQRRLKFQCCSTSCSYKCYSSSIAEFCLKHDIDLMGEAVAGEPETAASPDLVSQKTDLKRRKIQSNDSDDEMKDAGVAGHQESGLSEDMKSMVFGLAQEMRMQIFSEIGNAIKEALSAQTTQFEEQIALLKQEQEDLKKIIQELQAKPATAPATSYASVAAKPTGQKSPATSRPKAVDASKFMRQNADASLFNEAIEKLRRSSQRTTGPKELVTIYALRVRDLQPKDVRQALKLTTFNPRVIKDISFVARNTMALTLIKSSLPMLQEILSGLFGWTTTLKFDASKPFNAKAPEEIKAQVQSGSIRTYAKSLFRAEFIVKDQMLLAHHRTFVDSKGADYIKSVNDFLENIKRTPTVFFPNYQAPVEVAMEEEEEEMTTANVSWADEVVSIEDQIIIDYEEEVVPAAAEDQLLC